MLPIRCSVVPYNCRQQALSGNNYPYAGFLFLSAAQAMYAVVQFGQQWIFQLIAVSREMDAQLIAASHDKGDTGPLPFRHECFLSAPDTHAQAAGGAPPASPHPRY